MTDDVIVKFELNVDQPNDKLLDYAIQNIKENPDTRSQTIKEFKDLILERRECSPHRLDDVFLLRFLRARDFVLRDAHKNIVNYYEFKEKHPEYFKETSFARLIAIGDAKLVSTQPFLDQNGRRILFFHLGLWDPEKFSVVEIFQAVILALELGSLEPGSQILGGICVIDMDGINLQHLKHLSVKIIIQILKIILSVYPIRIHAIHVVNQSPIFKTAYAMIKPFLSKVKDRVFIHGSDIDGFYKHISPNSLPKTLGGIYPDYGYREWVQYIKNTKCVHDELNEREYNVVELISLYE